MKLPVQSPPVDRYVSYALTVTECIQPSDVEFSPGWRTPEEVSISDRQIERALRGAGGKLGYYANSDSGGTAVVVAGLHRTTHDPRPHVTVRLNNGGGHHCETWHVYLNSKGELTGTSQTFWSPTRYCS